MTPDMEPRAASALIPSLSVEMAYLALSVLLLLVHLSVQSFTYKAQVGNRFTVGPRDEEPERTACQVGQ